VPSWLSDLTSAMPHTLPRRFPKRRTTPGGDHGPARWGEG
jgi:hypothetical protein